MIEFRHVSAGYHEADVLKDISLHIPDGSITTLVGPNGCGKTTLLRAAARQLALRRGDILFNGRSICDFGRIEFARTAAFMPQVRNMPCITVEGLISHGRFPYLGLSRKLRPEDKEAVWQAMEDTGILPWAGRELRELSGGERQRVYIAMALAQDTGIIFLDEPTTYLDLHYQFELLELVQELNRRGKTIVMVLHDLSHALRYSSRIVLMQSGRIVLHGTPEELFASQKLDEVFHIRTHQALGSYYFTPQTEQG